MLDAVASRVAKEHGMQLSLDMSGDWRSAVLPELAAWLIAHKAAGNDSMVIEQFRAVAKNQPASSKAWGCLAAIACRAGLLEPMTHPDGSPVARPAESVKTHGHFVRVWRLTGARSTSQHDTGASVAACRTPETAHVGNAASATGGILAAVQAYHHQREAR